MGDPIPIRPKPAFKVDPKGQQTEWAGEEDDSDLAGRTQTVQQTIYAFTNIAPAEQELVPQFAAPAEPSAIEQLPAEVRDGFSQVLATLTGSKVCNPCA